jgi:hypothetical protein
MQIAYDPAAEQPESFDGTPHRAAALAVGAEHFLSSVAAKFRADTEAGLP